MGTYDELNAEHRRLEEQRQKELAEKAHQQEIDAAKHPENAAAKMPLTGRGHLLDSPEQLQL